MYLPPWIVDITSKIARIDFLISKERFIWEGSLEVVEHDWRLTVGYGDCDWLIDWSVDHRGARFVPGRQTLADPAGADSTAGEDQHQQDQTEDDEQDVPVLLEEVSAQHALQPLLHTVSSISNWMLKVLEHFDSLVVRILVVSTKDIHIIAVVHESFKVLAV